MWWLEMLSFYHWYQYYSLNLLHLGISSVRGWQDFSQCLEDFSHVYEETIKYICCILGFLFLFFRRYPE